MAFKHYDVVRAASPSDLAEKLTHKLKEGWQPFGSPVAITPYTLMQAIAAEGDVVVSGATEPDWYYVIVLAGHGVTDCYTLFRDAYHLAGTEMPDFHREDDWWRNGQNLYLDNMAVTGFYRVPLSSAQAGDILLCCFGASVPNHAAIYCGNGELLHHLPEQLSKRERYSEKWQRRTHSVWRHRHWHASAFTGIYNDLAAASACM